MAIDKKTVVEAVRARYGKVATGVIQGSLGSCCGTAAGSAGCCGAAAAKDAVSKDLYALDELEGLPLKAALASLGCGNPTALARLEAGQTVLDLGSGDGIDVLLSARRVGASGFAYGLDMTDEMLELARKNAAEAGVRNVEFLKGDIAAVPLPDASVDAIISNCVINLAADKAPVFAEAFRVLKAGGVFAVSDIVIHGGLPEGLVGDEEFRRDMSSWAGCIAGALTDTEYREGLAGAGFADIELEITRRYTVDDLQVDLPRWTARLGENAVADIVGRFASTFVRARKLAHVAH
jgi:ubiquinone/menaquinone biosynthesis C-methylase UbiE